MIRSMLLVLVVSTLAGCAGGTQGVFTNPKAARDEGIKLYAQKNYVDAAGAFSNAIRQDARDYRSYYYRGACYYEMGVYQQAIASYKASLSTMQTSMDGREDPDFRVKTIDALAVAIASSANRDEEVALLQKKADGKQTTENYFVYAKVCRNLGDADAAIDAYNRASLLEPKNFYVAKDFGLYLAQMNQPQRAEAALRRAYQLRQDDPEVNAALGQLGVIAGPSLKDKSNLQKPAVPVGPLPELIPSRPETASTPMN